MPGQDGAPGPAGVAPSGGAGIPELSFAVVEGAAEEYAAVPTLRFTLAMESRGGAPIQSVMLTAQLRIDVGRRTYDRDTQTRLVEVFGEPEQWARSARSLYWTHAAVIVPSFEARTQVPLLVPCTYDFDVAVVKYFHGVEDGDVPLEFLFSGSIFYRDARGLLATARIGWTAEATWRLPVRVWKEMMNHYFPNSAWLRVRRETFDRLYAYKARHALPTWEHALDALLPAGDPAREG